MINSKEIVEGYLRKSNWRVNENSNAPYSYGALGKHIIAEISKDYWLREVYEREMADAYREGNIHIHDLGCLTIYCCGYSLNTIIDLGVTGVPNIPESAPAEHFAAILNQVVNLTSVFQNEIAGAVAFSSLDTLTAPFVKLDGLNKKQVKQAMQNFVFSINSNSRGGAEPAFSNITFDITPSKDLLNKPARVANRELDFTYGDCQAEMDMINESFFELMIEGDAKGKPFPYPIPTYNIHDRFDWDSPKSELLWEMAGKYGVPYFANFLNSDMDPADARSMCCRLRLDLKELRKRNGGLFGSGDSTGSIGVVTLNLPRYGYLASGDKDEFYEQLEHYMDMAKDSLEIKRDFLQDEILDKGLIPAFMTYVGTIDNHFNTIGYIGLNELCMNLLGKDITHPEAKEFSIEVLEFMRAKLVEYQQETGHLFNLEATPAEGTTYRLAKKDLEQFPDIYTQGTKEAPYYTNSCHIPVKLMDNFKQILDHQEDLQVLHTGGTVIHFFLNNAITATQAKHIVRTACEGYKVPYISLSPINCYCDEHGHLDKTYELCPFCGKETDQKQRITGYLRSVKNFNIGKKAEFYDRRQLNGDSKI